MSERLRDVLAAHEGAFCICGELTTDPDAHLEAAVLAWLGELLGGDEAREVVRRAIAQRRSGHAADAALAAVRALVGGGA